MTEVTHKRKVRTSVYSEEEYIFLILTAIHKIKGDREVEQEGYPEQKIFYSEGSRIECFVFCQWYVKTSENGDGFGTLVFIFECLSQLRED